MPIAKTYKRYAGLSTFGVVGSPKSNIILLHNVQLGKNLLPGTYCVSAALENVIIWDVKKTEKALVLYGGKAEVTSIAKTKDNTTLAVGYSDGTIKLWNLKSNNSEISFSGHRSSISYLSFNKDGSNLVSGSTDTDIIVWDVFGERGLYRLKGHKGMVTSCCFMETKNILISSSKDMFVKFWDLDTQHCFLTLVGHKSEVWHTCLLNNETRLITGTGDPELKIYEIKETDSKEVPLECELLGSIFRQCKGRVMTLSVDKTGKYLACHGTDSVLEIFQILTEDEIEKALHKKKKKALKKQRKKPESEQTEEEISISREVTDEIKKIQLFQLKQKIRGCDISISNKSELRLLLLYLNNSIGFFKLDMELQPVTCQLLSMLSLMGHRTDVRTLAFNSDATLVLSGSGESIKLWNRTSQKCIRTLESDYCLCSCFVPGDRHVVIGTKTGKLQLFNISAGMLLESTDAHEGAVWSIALLPDKSGFVSGSADNEVKFWSFELVLDEEYSETSKRLTITHTQTLKMTEEILAVKFSPDGRLLGISLLDSTVKVFFVDTLKFFLSLYGHKFPVLCMDISLDSTLLVTGSADKNVKIWGLDFGDCHKSIFAHDDSITAIQFVSKTHYFFTASKDRTVKYWDADKFENIMTLEGHHAEIWAMAVSNSGEFVVTGSHDKSIRLWERTEELLVIEEEREMEREMADEMSMLERGKQSASAEDDNEATSAGKKTLETVKGAERIMEAIDLCKAEEEKQKENPNNTDIHPILKAYGNLSPVQYVLEIVRKVRSSELEESLLVLPFTYVISLLEIIHRWLKNNWEIELSTRCLNFLLKIHHNQLTSNKVNLSMLESLKTYTTSAVKTYKDTIGYNRAALLFLQQQLELKNVNFFEEAKQIFHKKKKTKHIVAFAT